MIEALAAQMSRSATGFAEVRDGILDILTVADTRRNASLRAVLARGVLAIPCPDEGCGCMERLADDLGIKIVSVKVEVV